ncbi:hypothetical protein B5C34_15295 [Pacificimonas flava]|uniref:glutathione transferase n=2 Tax=Pacificimonas TaxID=1960290 RepID=A0A219B0K8_9SPHN|nr:MULTISPECIES: glutathione S-transferase family protein [Pacificimonas]MBZ6379671.1 glutathione S-transferase family protein [Pacificimonas aurantium]OWV31865.1 hypothetical protein B5C34_15295 [Pacificimonas flava]
MKLFGATLSPFVRKTAAFLNEKGLNWDHAPIGLGSQDEEFLECSPFGKIPGFRDGEVKLSDSTAICVYLDAAYPEPRLIPERAEDRARAIWWDEIADTVLVAGVGKMFFNLVVAPRFLKQKGDEGVAEEGRGEVMKFMEFFEARAPEPGSFLVGGALTLADISMASPFVNVEHVGVAIPDSLSRTRAWVAAMHERESFAAMVAAERKIMAGEFGVKG